MSYTLKQAADATGKSKSTIFRAIKNHTISGTRDHNGEWLIDPSDLIRIFPLVSKDKPQDAAMTRSETSNEMMVLRREVEVREQQLVAERTERERERGILQETITDLRTRLDLEGEERRKAQTQLTALLTDQRTQAEKAAGASPVLVLPTRSIAWGWWLACAVIVVAAVWWWVLNHPPSSPS